MYARLPVFLSLAAGLTASLGAQTLTPLPPTGNFTQTAFGMVWDQAQPGQPRKIHARGFDVPDQVSLMPVGTPFYPGFELNALTDAVARFIDPNNPPTLPPVELSGISSHNDVVFMRHNGRWEIGIPNGNVTPWGVIFVAVDGEAPPFADGSALEMQRIRLGHVGSEIVGYYYENAHIPGFMVDETYLEGSPSLMGPLPVDVGQPPQLMAMDINMPNIVLRAGEINIPELPVTDKVAFTLSRGYIQTLETLRPGQIGGLHPTSVITATWNPLTVRWEDVQVIFDHSTDVTDPVEDSDAIDAIAVGNVAIAWQEETNIARNANRPDFIIYSLDDVTKEQLLVTADISTPTGRQTKTGPLFSGPASVPNTSTIAVKMGLGTGHNIRAICAQDPESSTYGRLSGHPKPDVFSIAPSFVMSSVVRDGGTLDWPTKTAYIFASGRESEPSLVVAYFGLPGLPLIDIGSSPSALLGQWNAFADTFTAVVPDLPAVQYEVALVRCFANGTKSTSNKAGHDAR